MTFTHHTRLFRLLAGLAALFLLAACGPAETNPQPTTTTSDGAFPRSVSVPAGKQSPAVTVAISDQPRRIAALTYETAEVVAELGAAEQLVMIPEAIAKPFHSSHHEELSKVETKASGESSINAEAVLATNPDLVLLSARHGLEDGAAMVLEAAGVPVLVLPNTWSNVADMYTNIGLIGQALGLDAQAQDVTEEIRAAIADSSPANPAQEPGADAPRVLVLSNQAGRPFVTAGGAFPLEMLRLAGAEDASAVLEMTRSGPITAEQIIQADPAAVLLVDMNDSGRKVFEPLLANDAIAGLPGFADSNLMLIEGRYVQALGMTEVGDGLETLTQWVDGIEQ